MHVIEQKIDHTGRGITNELFFKCAKSSANVRRARLFEKGKIVFISARSMSKSGMAQISSFATKNDRENDESVPQPGLVKNVCRQWIVHEDEGLAHRLQEDEFRSHFGRNKEHHRTVQSDIKVAKKSHSEELQEIQQQHLLRARKLKELEDQDHEVAERLQKLLVDEQNEHNHRRRHQDQMLALELEEEERLKPALSEQRNRHPVPPASTGRAAARPHDVGRYEADLLVSSSNDAVKHQFEAPVRPPRKHAGNARGEPDRRTQEQQDEALARALQEEEQAGAHVHNDFRLALESQDAEYAKILEEKERERYRRAKEKQKAKQEANTLPVTSPSFDNFVPGNPASRSMSLPLANQGFSETSRNLSKNAIVYSPAEADSPRNHINHRSSPVNNIATLIDPTYGRLHGRDSDTIPAPAQDRNSQSNTQRNDWNTREAVSEPSYAIVHHRKDQNRSVK